MTRITTLYAGAFLATFLASTPIFSQSSDRTVPPPVSGPQGNLPGDRGGDGTGYASARASFEQAPVVTGLDLKGPPQTKGPFAE